MSSYTVRSWVTIGLFGALWAAVELTLGSYLHVIFPPQVDTFLTGVVMGGIGVAVALTGRHFVPNRGSVPNLPEDAILEMPAVATAGGLRPIRIPDFPDTLAAITLRKLTASSQAGRWPWAGICPTSSS